MQILIYNNLPTPQPLEFILVVCSKTFFVWTRSSLQIEEQLKLNWIIITW